MWYIIKKKKALGVITVVVAILNYRPHKVPVGCLCVSKQEYMQKYL